jgi:hypothetical protein
MRLNNECCDTGERASKITTMDEGFSTTEQMETE